MARYAEIGEKSVGRSEKTFGKSLIFSVLPETQSIYALLIAILALVVLGLVAA